MNWILLLAVTILALAIVKGYQTGFLKTLYAMVHLVVILVLVLVFSPIVKEVLRSSTEIYDQVKVSVELTIENSLPEIMIDMDLPEGMGIPEQLEALAGIELPENVQKLLVEHAASSELLQGWLQDRLETGIHESVDGAAFVEGLSDGMAEVVLTVLGFLITFVVVWITSQIVVFVFDVIGKLPLVGGINRAAGAALGAAQGILILWVLCLVVTAFPDAEWSMVAMNGINTSEILTFLYNNNLLIKLIIAIGL